jgi:hypothetical protein
MGEEARIALAFATPAMRRKGWFAGMAGAGQARHFPVRLTCRIHFPDSLAGRLRLLVLQRGLAAVG